MLNAKTARNSSTNREHKCQRLLRWKKRIFILKQKKGYKNFERPLEPRMFLRSSKIFLRLLSEGLNFLKLLVPPRNSIKILKWTILVCMWVCTYVCMLMCIFEKKNSSFSLSFSKIQTENMTKFSKDNNVFILLEVLNRAQSHNF